MVSKIDLQACKSEFESHLVPHSFGLMLHLSKTLSKKGGARCVMVIVVGNGHGDTSSNPGRDWLHFI